MMRQLCRLPVWRARVRVFLYSPLLQAPASASCCVLCLLPNKYPILQQAEHVWLSQVDLLRPKQTPKAR